MKVYGMSHLAYYLGFFISDYLIYLSFSGPYCMVINFLANFKNLQFDKDIIIKDILIFGFSVIPLMYLLSLFFRKFKNLSTFVPFFVYLFGYFGSQFIQYQYMMRSDFTDHLYSDWLYFHPFVFLLSNLAINSHYLENYYKIHPKL